MAIHAHSPSEGCKPNIPKDGQTSVSNGIVVLNSAEGRVAALVRLDPEPLPATPHACVRVRVLRRLPFVLTSRERPTLPIPAPVPLYVMLAPLARAAMADMIPPI